MPTRTIRSSPSLANVRYEIRGKLARRAQEMERMGYDITMLNIGNPGAFGFRTPETMRLGMIENLRSSEGYCHQKGIFPAREAVVMQQQDRGVRGVSADDVFIDMPLRILTPGVSDTFEISPYPYRFVIAMEPEKIIQKGTMKASQYNTRNPSYRVKVYKGAKIVADRDSRDGIRFDGLVLSFFEPTVWVQIEMVKDPGVLLILAGLLLTVMGIPLSAAGLISCALRKHAQSKAVVMAA